MPTRPRPAELPEAPAAAPRPTGAPPASVRADLDRLDRLAQLLDAQFRLPGTRWRFGWDSIVGLVPGVGDFLVALPSAWMILEGRRLGVPNRVLVRMAANTGADFVVGSVPILGNVFDFFFKANLRNAALLRAAAAALPPRAPDA